MSNLRIKVKYKSFEIELDGEEKTVQSQFEDIKQNGLSNIVMGVDLSDRAHLANTELDQPRAIQAVQTINAVEDSLPNIKNVVMSRLPNTETEWILVYGYYTSKQGEETFIREDITNYYDQTSRKTISRANNLTNNINSLVLQQFLEALNDTEFIFTDEGKNKVVEILQRTNGATKKKTSSKSNTANKPTKAKSKKANTYSILSDLNLNPKSKESLQDFYSKYKPKNYYEKNLIIIYYLKMILKLDNIGFDHFYTSYKSLQIQFPSIVQSIRDTGSDKGWIDTSRGNDLKLTSNGENYIEHKMTKAN